MLRGERKSVEPIAAVTAPARVTAQHQSPLHFVGEGREMVLPEIERQGPIEAWIIDDTGLPKKGGIRSVLRGNIAVSLTRKTIAKSRCRCR